MCRLLGLWRANTLWDGVWRTRVKQHWRLSCVCSHRTWPEN
uniref:Uncharacterized protein n=1 Tax=Medicago truncatula TaxID=3880 RepID=I3SUM8_MEDTR|nr:unknown [Medicago truncatula]